MKAGNKPRTVTEGVSAKVAPEELKAIRQKAAEAGLSVSEWARRALVNAISLTPEGRVLLSELMAMRAVLLSIQLRNPDAGQITEAQMKKLVDEADVLKFAMADKRILAAGLGLTTRGKSNEN